MRCRISFQDGQLVQLFRHFFASGSFAGKIADGEFLMMSHLVVLLIIA